MGFRFRKSINLGGGFRINLSKSGVGYSWGVKGYRVTKTPKGRLRTTASIPGTGISYVNEIGKTNRKETKHTSSPSGISSEIPVEKNFYDTQNIVNNVADEMVSDGLEDMLTAANRILKLNTLSNVGILVFLILGFGFPALLIVAGVFIILKIFVRTKGTIDLNYTIDIDQQPLVDKQMKPALKITQCAKVWRIMQTSKVINKKYASGANAAIDRHLCKVSTKAPFPFRANLQVASFKSGGETLLFLPDKLFIIQGNKIGALNYNDISTHAHLTNFVEDESVPTDSKIVGRTWKYVNKSGGPDKRFKDNKQLPICLYGELELSSNSGLNTIIMFSNPDNASSESR